MSAKRRRLTANPAQLRTELCAELKSLCESFAADGRLVPAEIDGLRTWLRDSAGVDLPQDLRNIVSRVIVTGQLTADERRAIYGTVDVVGSAESAAAIAAVASSLSGTSTVGLFPQRHRAGGVSVDADLPMTRPRP